jgi:hypothetical protein
MIRFRTLLQTPHEGRTRYEQVRHGARMRGGHDGECVVVLVDARFAGTLLNVPATWLLEEASSGRIPHYLLGDQLRFDPLELGEWIYMQKVEVRSEED